MRLLILLSFFIALSAHAQLEFVGSYTSTARLIYLSDNEPAIFLYDQFNEHIELYNTDLTLISSFDIPVEYEGSGQYNLFHVSRTLFDCDTTNIEYLISYGSSNLSNAYVKIIREDGSVIFDLPEHIFADEDVLGSIPTIDASMVNDENGVLFMFFNAISPSPGQPTSVYRSCGSIPGCSPSCDVESGTVGLNENMTKAAQVNLFPNPGNNQFALHYDLSAEFSSATLTLVDLQGKEVLHKKIGPSMGYILVNTTSLTSGRYEVVLRTEEGSFISASYVELD